MERLNNDMTENLRLALAQKLALIVFPFAAFYYALAFTRTSVPPWQRVFMILIPKGHIYMTTDDAFDEYRRGVLIWYFLGIIFWVVLFFLLSKS